MGGAGKRLGPRRACLVHHIREEAEEPGPLDRPRQLALLLRRDRGDAARHDLAALGDEALQQADVLVVDLRRVRAGERAGFAASEKRPAGDGRTTASRRCALAFHLRLHLVGFRGDRRLGRALDRSLGWSFGWPLAVARLAVALAPLAIAVAVAARPVLAAAAA